MNEHLGENFINHCYCVCGVWGRAKHRGGNRASYTKPSQFKKNECWKNDPPKKKKKIQKTYNRPKEF